MADVQQAVLKRIYDQLTQGKHNDLQLVFQDGSITGSRICLTALSPYFEAMFTYDMLEKTTGVIKLPTITSSTFHNILKCYFLGEKVVNELNCFPLLEAAEMMQLDHLKSLCLDYLSNNLTLTTDNCVDMWRSLKKFNFKDLATKAFQCMISHVEGLSQSECILSLTGSEYIELLSQDDLHQKEDDVLRDVQTWIKTNNPSIETMVDLFKVIRFEHVTLTYLHHDVIFSSIVKEHEELQQLVQEGLTKHSLRHDAICMFTDRRPSKVDVMFVLNNSLNVLSAACLTDNTWYRLPPAPYNPGNWFAGAVLGERIYITGGTERETTTMVYDVLTQTWIVGPNLKQIRCEHCMTAVDDKLYVIGGKYSNTIEQLQQGHSDWQVVSDLGCSRRDSCCESVGQNVVIMGGKVNGLPSMCVHCLNTTTHAVCIIHTHETSATVTRSYLDMPHLYLLHYDGGVDVVHVGDSNKPILSIERVAKHEQYGYWFGFVYKDGNIVVVTKKGLQKVNIRDGYKENITFQHTPTLDYINGTLTMRVPRLSLSAVKY